MSLHLVRRPVCDCVMCLFIAFWQFQLVRPPLLCALKWQRLMLAFSLMCVVDHKKQHFLDIMLMLPPYPLDWDLPKNLHFPTMLECFSKANSKQTLEKFSSRNSLLKILVDFFPFVIFPPTTTGRLLPHHFGLQFWLDELTKSPWSGNTNL